MEFKAKRLQRGDALITAIIAALIFHVIGYVIIEWTRIARENRAYAAQTTGLRAMHSALMQYARANQASFKSGKEIMYVNDQYAPSVSELTSLGFLSLAGPEITAPWGGTFGTKLKLETGGAITGYVYLNGNIKNSVGAVDRVRACNIAKTLGDIGLCTPPSNAAFLGNLMVQVANPSSSPAAIGAYVAIPP